MLRNRHKLANKQDGFASILIAMVLVLVLSLITVGFAQLMQREQRSALDKQLASQAYYAAESGINDAAKAINAGFAVAKPTCAEWPSASTVTGSEFLKSRDISPDKTGSSYPCLIIDPTPFSLEYGKIETNKSKTITITGVDPANNTQYRQIGSLVISWQDASDTQQSFVTDGAHTFMAAAEAPTNWSYTSVLRIGLTPLSSGNINRDYLNQNTMLAFLYPKGGGPSTPSYSHTDYNDLSGNNAGAILDGNCVASPTAYKPRYCNVRITNLGQVNYLLNMRSVYSNSQVTITAYATDGTTKLRIKNAQTLVDSTGKAQDVLKRVQVRIPAHNDYPRPDYDLQTADNICKLLKLTTTSNNGPTTCNDHP